MCLIIKDVWSSADDIWKGSISQKYKKKKNNNNGGRKVDLDIYLLWGGEEKEIEFYIF